VDLWDVLAGGAVGALFSIAYSKRSSDKFLSDEELEEQAQHYEKLIAERKAREAEAEQEA